MNLHAPSMLVLEGGQIPDWYNCNIGYMQHVRVLEGGQIPGWYNGFLAKRHSTCWNAVLLLRENKPRIHRNVSSIRNIEDINPWFAPRFAPLSQSSHLCRSRHAPADTMRSTTRARFCVSSKSARFQVDTIALRLRPMHGWLSTANRFQADTITTPSCSRTSKVLGRPGPRLIQCAGISHVRRGYPRR